MGLGINPLTLPPLANVGGSGGSKLRTKRVQLSYALTIARDRDVFPW